MASKGKSTAGSGGSAKGKAAPAQKKPDNRSDIDRRWSILLFGLGLLFLALSFVPGESVWAWIRENLLFATFGISGWLVGPLLVFCGVLVSVEKPVFSAVVKCILFMLALSGLALVFGKTEFADLGFGESITTLLATGRESAFGGGLLGFVGWAFLVLFGRTAARIVMVLLILCALMLVTGVGPVEIVRFFARRRAARYDDYDEEYEEYAEAYEPEPVRGRRAAPPVQAAGGRRPAAAASQPPAPAVPVPRRRSLDVDIDLGPGVPLSEPGGGETDEVEIGPGGTFGMDPLKNGEEGYGFQDEPLIPFDPYSTRSLFREAEEEAQGKLLFGEEDPYNQLGGAGSVLPRANRLDVEYVGPPQDDPEFDLFGNPVSRTAQAAGDGFGQRENGAGVDDGMTAVQPAGLPDMDAPALRQGKAAVAGAVASAVEAGTAMAGEDVSSGASDDPDVAALIDRADSQKSEGNQPVADKRPGAADLLEPYHFPPLELLGAEGAVNTGSAKEEMKKTADLLVSTLASFGVQTRILDVSRGPSVTRYEVQPQAGVKISRITNLADDIALNLAAAGVRIEAPIPGKPAVGIEVPNKVKTNVTIRSILESGAFANSLSPLSIALGKDIAGDNVVADLTRMPHLLVAGSTGSGKSVCINATIMSFVYKSSPEDVRLVLIDPKVVELAEYNGLPHLLMPVVTEPRKAAGALGAMVAEMEKRYHLFAENNVRDITTFNKLAARKGDLERLPHIAIVIDELADLMMTSGKEVEDYICRIAQKARAAGMHLIVATQRPSVDVITGLIKANIPSRIAFAVSSQVDSRTILDGAGAEKLLGMGDMLFMPVGANKPVRVQGTYVKDKEISAVLRYIKANSGGAEYDDGLMQEMERMATVEKGGGDADGDGEDMIADPTFINAVETTLELGQISTSMLQRKLRLGYARAGRIMDEMERLHIVSPPEGSKPRQVLISRQQWQEMSMNAGE